MLLYTCEDLVTTRVLRLHLEDKDLVRRAFVCFRMLLRPPEWECSQWALAAAVFQNDGEFPSTAAGPAA